MFTRASLASSRNMVFNILLHGVGRRRVVRSQVMHSIFPRAGQAGILGVFGPQTTRQKGLRPSDNFLLRLFGLESLKTTSRYLSSRIEVSETILVGGPKAGREFHLPPRVALRIQSLTRGGLRRQTEQINFQLR